MDKVIKALRESENVRIICHSRPDGDAIGSTLALSKALVQLGKNVEILCDEQNFPKDFEFLIGYDAFNKRLDTFICDTAIALDCSDSSRLGAFFTDFSVCQRKINIDHHKTNGRFGDLNFVDGNMSSTCEIVFNILSKMDVKFNVDIATPLYVGISTDTGNFMHSNTLSSALYSASELLKFGVDVTKITYTLYKKTSIERMKLLAKVLSNVKLFNNGSICILTVMNKDLEELGINSNATSGLVDYAINIDTVKVGVCILQTTPKAFKISMRSKEPVDCSDICSAFGGGGHRLASGCLVCGFYEDVIDKLIKAITDRM